MHTHEVLVLFKATTSMATSMLFLLPTVYLSIMSSNFCRMLQKASCHSVALSRGWICRKMPSCFICPLHGDWHLLLGCVVNSIHGRRWASLTCMCDTFWLFFVSKARITFLSSRYCHSPNWTLLRLQAIAGDAVCVRIRLTEHVLKR